MKKSLWKGAISLSGWPFLPCPKCLTGDLRLDRDSLKRAVPRYAQSHEFDPNIPERFIVILTCAKPGCGEKVAVAGEVFVEPEYDHENSLNWVPYLQAAFMRPAPPIIAMPKRTPNDVVKELKLSFELYWVDYNACASRLRTSLERLMDNFGVAKTRIQENKDPSKPGKRRVLDLSARIDKMAKKVGTREHVDMFHALRTIGNLGTHSSRVTQAAVLDAYQLYEMALEELFKDRSESAKDIIKRLKAHK